MSVEAVDTVLLAGGLSQRFGRPKAGAEWRGSTLAARVLSARPACPGRTVLVLRAEDDPRPVSADVVTWDDPADPPGPLRGVIAGLRACNAEWAWVTACDLPGLTPAVLTLLRAEARPGDDVVVPEWDGREQPLCALYAVSAAEGLAAALADGERSLAGALKRLSVRRLPQERIRSVDPAGTSFVNVNRPEDLALLEQKADRQENDP